MRIPILYRDDDIVVVNKPAGIPTHAVDSADPYPGDALRIVQAQTGLAYLGMHQRLDAETTGVLLFSARQDANRSLAATFEGREIDKAYLALVYGRPARNEGTIVAPIARDRDSRYRVTTPQDPRGQPAVTHYRVLQTARRAARSGLTLSLLEATPETGRTHQIRVHLAHIGHPVVGDRLYAPDGPAFPVLCLHAARLVLPHPGSGRRVTFTAPLPLPGQWRGPVAAATAGDVAAEGELGARHVGMIISHAGMPVREAIATSAEATAGLLRLIVERRSPLAADPAVTIYRLVNGAADGLPGLTVDRYGEVIVAGLYDEDIAADGAPEPIPPVLVDVLSAVTGAASVYVKYRPRQASHIADEQMPSLAPPQPVSGPDLAEFAAQEDGLAYLIRPGAGLSVGLFPDMREGRGRIRAWSAGKRVLNTFAYTCGFGVAALAGGASRVLNLDLAKPVLAWGQENYRLNGFTPDPHDFVYGDVFDWLARLARRGDLFDLVILDPPGFSRTKTRRFSAARDYGELASLAARCTAAEGMILACCNVAELPWRAFRDRVLAGVAETGRQAEVTGVYHEPGVDFPVPAGQEPYLKMLAMRLT
jgi:23S rRNA (cytosine1962-C5)-methyltransferase